jgi:hypothetical protein
MALLQEPPLHAKGPRLRLGLLHEGNKWVLKKGTLPERLSALHFPVKLSSFSAFYASVLPWREARSCELNGVG